MIFENVDDPDYADQKISFTEKAIIIALIPLIKLGMWKVKRAKTYGDLQKLANLFKKKAEEFEKRIEEENPEMEEKELPKEIHKFTNELNNSL